MYFSEILPAAAAASVLLCEKVMLLLLLCSLLTHLCVCLYVHLYVCVYVCMCMCVCGAQRQISQTTGSLCICVCVCVRVARSGKHLKQQEQQHVMRWSPDNCMPHRMLICKRTIISSAGDWAASRTRWGQSSRRRFARWHQPRWCLSWIRTAWSTRAPRCSCSKPVGQAHTWSLWSCRGGWRTRSRVTSSDSLLACAAGMLSLSAWFQL